MAAAVANNRPDYDLMSLKLSTYANLPEGIFCFLALICDTLSLEGSFVLMIFSNHAQRLE